jgi:uncharacterized protein
VTAEGSVQVRDAPDESRYEAWLDGEVAGVLEYRRTSQGVVVLTHTEVDDTYEGRGVGSDLVRAVLDDLRDRGLGRVRVRCPFVTSWLERHPEYEDVVEPRSGAGGG